MVARYGEEDRRLEDGGWNCSDWWKEVVKIWDGVGDGVAGWFEGCVVRRLGDGADTSFWRDRWCGEVSFRSHCSRLYDLVVDKSVTVRSMFLHSWEEGGGVEVALLEECRMLLLDVSLQNLSDVWQWLPNISGGYSVSGAYDMLTFQEPAQIWHDLNLIWHKHVPLKVFIFAWRLLRDRLHTKPNLATHSVISSRTCSCVSGCGQVEDARHFLLSCTFFMSIWPLLRS